MTTRILNYRDIDDMPALNNRPVTERHARTCREYGHATHIVNNEFQPHCPRCGESRLVEIAD